MMNPGRYDGGYAVGEDVPQSPSSAVSQYVATAQEAIFPHAVLTPTQSAAAFHSNGGDDPVTREEREAHADSNTGPHEAHNPTLQREGFIPGFYAGFSAPQPQTTAAHTASTTQADVASIPTDAEEQEPSMKEILSKVVIHTHKPIENLPTISPPELKIIGRAVTFKGETKIGEDTVMMHYEGLVGTINKDTVMLIHAHRFTEEDYQIHKLEVTEQQQSEERDENAKAQGGEVAGKDGAAPRSPPPRGGDEGTPQSTSAPSPRVSEADGLDMGQGHLASSSLPALPNAITGDDHGDTNQRVRNRLRNHTGSMGPIPFMTFSRSHIHQVEFARDPRSDFYSLFRDPTKYFFDMQCLRMFCRRYIVHTAQGNNPRQVPLRAFVTCRCNCNDLDNDLLIRVTHEEIGHLVKVHRDAQRAKKRKETNRRSILRLYRAPPGLFRNTGVLYLTHIPKQTFVLGVLQVIMAVVVALFAAVSLSTSPPLFISSYLNAHTPFILPGIIFGAMAGFFATMHAVRMSLPFSSHFVLSVARIIVVTSAIAMNLMSMVMIGESFKVGKVRRAYYEFPERALCDFFRVNGCLGFDNMSCTPSVQGDVNPLCGCFIAEAAPPCRYIIMGSIERTMIPIVCFTLVLFILHLFDHFMHYKLFYVGRLLAQRM